MPIVKKLSSLVSIKRKTPTDRLPTGYLGDNAVATPMLRDGGVTPAKLSFALPTTLVNMPLAAGVVSQGQVVYWAGSAFDLALATTPTLSKVVGFAINDQTGALKDVLVSGVVQNVFTGLTPNAVYYLSQSSAGAITATPPSSGLVIKVGRAISATQLKIEIEEIGIFDAGSGPTSIDFANGSIQSFTQTAAITSFSNAVAGKWYTLIVTSNGTAYNFPASLTWAVGYAPPADGAGAVKVILVLCQTATSFIGFSLGRDRNAELLAANYLGSIDSSLDKSSAGRGIFLRRPDGTLREITIDDNDQIAVYSV